MESEDRLPGSVGRARGASSADRSAAPAFPAAIPCGGPGRPPRLPARSVPPRPTCVYGPLPAGPAARLARAALAHLGPARTLRPPRSAAPPRRVPDDVTEAGGAVPTGAGWGPELPLAPLPLLSRSPFFSPPPRPLLSPPLRSSSSLPRSLLVL